MCGIAGWLDWSDQPNVAAVERMTNALRHRGPDAGGVHVSGPVALGHRRLSIIDVAETNNQPLFDSQGRYCIVFNGEIYNFADIRKCLESAGARFRTSGDTEVIIEAYRYWGEACLTHLNGMFAFAIWDEEQRELFLARDRTGEKPLFYVETPSGAFAFASEPQALRRHAVAHMETDPASFASFLALGYVAGDGALTKGIRSLPPAHSMKLSQGSRIRPRKYWSLENHFHNKIAPISESEAAEELLTLIDDAVRLRQISDVPLGAFLSGGIDSSSIVASMCSLLDPAKIQTFCAGFDEAGYSEAAAAAEISHFLHTSHHSHEISRDTDLLIRAITAAAAEPIADTSAIPMYLLAEFSRRHVTVCLSGDGADEIFAGYETYVADQLHARLDWIPKWGKRALNLAATHALPVTHGKVSFDFKARQFTRGLTLDRQRAHFSWRVLFDQHACFDLLQPGMRDMIAGHDPYDSFAPHFGALADAHPVDQAMYVDIKTWLPNDILVKVDRMTMAHSLEARAPFLDHRIIEFAASLPVSYKLRGLQKKYLLRQSQQKRLPPSQFRRKKLGFNAPVSYWFAGPLNAFAHDILADRALDGWFDRAAVNRLLSEHERRQQDHGMRLLILVSFAIWLKS